MISPTTSLINALELLMTCITYFLNDILFSPCIGISVSKEKRLKQKKKLNLANVQRLVIHLLVVMA
jgi:hypothetical protein